MKLIHIIAAAATVLACGTASAQGHGEVLKFQDYPSTGGNLLIRVAIEKGYCEKYGIKCVLQSVPSAPLGLQVLTAKSIDVSMTPLSVQVAATLRGAKVRAIAGGVVDNVGKMVVRNEALGPNADKNFPDAIRDLKGKKIGVTARGGSAELQVQFLMEKAGMKASDVTIVAVGGANTAMSSLLSGQIDAAFTYEPAASMCKIGKKCKVVYDASADKNPPEIFATNGAQQNMVMRQEMIDEHPELADAVIKAATDAQQFLQDPKNFDEVIKISEKYFKLQLPQAAEITAASMHYNIPASRVTISRSAVKATVDLMLYQKALPKAVPVEDLLYQKAP